MKLKTVLDLLRLLKQMRTHEQWSSEQLLAYQDEALRKLRSHAYANSPFYQEFHQGLAARPLTELPILTKKTLVENFNQLVTDKAVTVEMVRQHIENAVRGQKLLNRYRVSATSGSTGQPGLFLFDDAEWLIVLGSFARAHEWAGVDINLTHRMRMASVASTSDWHMSSQVGATLNSWWMPALRLAASDPLQTLVNQLNAWQPDMLVTYASMARVLASEQLEGRLHIHPHLVFTSSEVLTDETCRRVELAWGRTPFNEYATTEVGTIAAEHLSDHHLHTFEDLLIVESVDARGQPVPQGEYGEKVLVTSLFSRTLPLIRYEIGDSISMRAAPNSSNLPFAIVDGVQGRVEDTLNMPGITGGRVEVHPLVFNRVMDALPMSGWRVVQQPDDSLKILLGGLHGDLSETTLTNALEAALRAVGATAPLIGVELVETIPKSASGKSPLIQAYRAPLAVT
jgi:phenylacetate-coenzyme A ligase PaaK-like adenylate-forming protein